MFFVLTNGREHLKYKNCHKYFKIRALEDYNYVTMIGVQQETMGTVVCSWEN